MDQLSDQKLRENLQELGFTPGPITSTTRTVLERKLRRLSTDKVSSGAEAVDCGEVNEGLNGGHHEPRRRSTGRTPSSVLDKSSNDACPIADVPHEDTSNYKDIFLSYSRELESTKFVAELKKQLESADFSVWMDTEDIHTGSDWHTAIGEALQNCKALIAVMTTRYLTSDYCKKELYMASDEKKPIFPVILGDVDFSKSDGGVRYTISSLNRICFEDTSDQKAFTKLLEGLKHKVVPSISRKPLKSFTVDEVCAFVEKLDISSKLFKANSVSGEDLYHLGDGDLKTELKLKPLQIRKLRRHMDQGSK